MNKIIARNGKRLREKKNVVTVGEGLKIKNGYYTGERAIVIGVIKKQLPSELTTKDFIPSRIARIPIIPAQIWGIKTDVIEVGEIKALELDRTARHRPAMGGISIGHPDVTAGTLSRLVKKNEETYILSNNHVLANLNEAAIGDPTYQPGVADGGGPDDEIGRLAYYVKICQGDEASICPISHSIVKVFNFFAKALGRKTRLEAITSCVNTVDCALSKVNSQEDVSEEILGLGYITGEAEPELNMVVSKSGRTTGVTTGRISQINVEVAVNMGNKLGTITFSDQFMVLKFGMCKGGDSGSIVLTDDNRCVGLLFAGSEFAMVANKYSNVKKALGLD